MMKMKRCRMFSRSFNHAILVICIAAFASGCMVILPTSSISTNQEPEKIVERIEYNANRCWSTLHQPIHSDIVVNTYTIQNGYKLTASRKEGSTPQYPFLHVTVTHSTYGSEVSVREGEFNLGTDLNLSDDVNRWINGDNSC